MRTSWIVVAVLTIALAGCSGGGQSPGAAPPEMEPTATSEAALSAVDPPKDYREVRGQGFTVHAPSAYQSSTAKSRNGQPMLVLQRPSSSAALPASLAVVRDVEPVNDVIEQSYTLEVAKRTLNQASDVSRSELTWPGARRAVLVQWTQDVPAGQGESLSAQYLQLNLEVSDDLILAVVAVAPIADVEPSAIRTILGTVRPDPATA